MPSILIAEDDLLIATMVEELLVQHGYAVCGIGRNVTDSLALAQRHHPDLAILDVRLADGDLGTEIAGKLAGNQRLGILYVAGDTTSAMLGDVHGHACLAKPYRPHELLRSLEIVAEMIVTGEASAPFPSRFWILPWTTCASANTAKHRFRSGDPSSADPVQARTGSGALGAREPSWPKRT